MARAPDLRILTLGTRKSIYEHMGYVLFLLTSIRSITEEIISFYWRDVAFGIVWISVIFLSVHFLVVAYFVWLSLVLRYGNGW